MSALLDRIAELRVERDEAREAAIAMATADGFDPSDSDYQAIEKRAVDADTRIVQLTRLHEASVASAELDGRLRTVSERRADVDTRARSLGLAFAESDQLRAWPGHGASGRFEVSQSVLELRAPIDTTAAGTYWAPKERVTIPTFDRQRPLLTLMRRQPVSANSVEWVEKSGAAPLAAIVAEGAAKPEATVTWSVKSATLDTIAHWVQITRQVSEDAPALRAYIEGELIDGVLDKLEAEAAAALVAATLPAVTAATLLASIRVALANVQDAGYSPTAVVLNPLDYADLDIEVFGSTLLGPSVSGRFWGLTPVASSAVAEGTAFVGDFNRGATWFDRGAVSVHITDSHLDTFIKNVFTVLAETRGKMAVTNPSAIVEASVTP